MRNDVASDVMCSNNGRRPPLEPTPPVRMLLNEFDRRATLPPVLSINDAMAKLRLRMCFGLWSVRNVRTCSMSA